MNLSDQITVFYRSWYSFVEKQRSYGEAKWVMIDDLSKSNIIEVDLFNSEDEVVSKLNELIQCVSNSTDLNFPKDETLSRLNDSLYFLEFKDISKESITKLNGVWWEIPSSEIEDINAKYNTFSHLPSSLNDIIDTEDFLILLKEKSDYYYSKVIEHLGLEIVPELNIKTVQVDEKWRNMITYEDGVLYLVINTHPMHQYTTLQAYSYAIHEVCGHVLHFSYILENQQDYSHLNQICLHTKASAFVEGFAHYIHKYCAYELFDDDILKYSFEYFRLRFALIQKNAMDIAEEIKTPKEAAVYHSEVTKEELESLIQQYEKLSESKFFMFQTHSYHNGLRWFESLESKHNSKKDFLRYMLDHRSMATFVAL